MNYPIDTAMISGAYTPAPALLTATISAIGSSVAYEETYYEVTMTPKKNLPAGAIILIQFPAEITTEDKSVSRCRVNVNGGGLTSYADCELVSTSPPIFKIPSALGSAFNANGSKTIIAQVGNLRNPRSTKPTSSFSIYLQDSS